MALSELGRKEEALTKFCEAIASYEQAVAIKPDKHEAWYNRGLALSDLGRKEEAIASYDQAIAIKPDYHEAWYNKACCYSLQQKIELAIETLQHAIALDAEYRELAKTDSDFDGIRNDERFRALIGESVEG